MPSPLPLSTPCLCSHTLDRHQEGADQAPCKIPTCGCRGFLPQPVPQGDVRKKQVGGDHYAKRAIQPWDIWEEYGLDPWRANAIKYLLRAGTKDGVPALQDLKKARHTLDRLIEIEEQRGGE